MKKIKSVILYILLVIFKYHLKIIYFFIKIFTIRKNRVFLLSRQFNEIPLNYEFLIKALNKDNIETKVICKKVSNGLNATIRNEKKSGNLFKELGNMIGYYFNLYKQMHYCATSKVIIVDGYNLTVSMLKHKKGTKVIQLWHALAAIKKFGYQTIGYSDGLNPKVAKLLCMHKNYDYVISGSEAMNKYFSEAFNVSMDKMVAIGTPVCDYLLNKNDRVVKRLYKKYPQLKNKINVLYSPTFRSDGRDNNDEVISKFNTDKFNLILAFHPKNNEVSTNKNVICIDRNEFMTFDVLRVVDYVITDYSALAIDACVMNKKIILYVYDYEQYDKENGINIDLFNELEGNVYKDFDDIVHLLENNLYNQKSYNKFRKKYSGNIKGDSTKKLVSIIKESL